MSKILHASKIVDSNRDLPKKELVALIEKELGVTKANARVYLYNVGKRKDKAPAPIKVKQEQVTKVKRIKDSKVLEPIATAA